MGLLDLLTPKKRRTGGATGAAAALYATAVAQARAPSFYTALGVPDTLDGRFDLLVVHVHLLCRRLARGGDSGAALAQALFDAMFKDMDRNLREMGVGDPSIPRRIKSMGQAYYGRVAAYEGALTGTGEGLAAALARNVLGTPPLAGTLPSPAAEAMAAYVRAAATALDAADTGTLAAGRWAFPAPPAAA